MAAPRQRQSSPASATSLPEAIELHRRGRLGEAEQYYAAMLAREPAAFDPLYLLGLLNYQRGRYAAALALVAAALRTDGASFEALSLSALVLDGLARHDEALARFDRALLVRPNDADALSNRGETLMRLGR